MARETFLPAIGIVYKVCTIAACDESHFTGSESTFKVERTIHFALTACERVNTWGNLSQHELRQKSDSLWPRSVTEEF